MKKFILLLAFIGLLSAEDSTYKVVIDLTTSSVENFQKKILKGIVAHKNYYEGKLKELEVAVVIHGGAYRFFVKDPKKTIYKDDKELLKAYAELKTRIESLSDTYAVEFLMCEVGMKKNKLKEKNIVSFVELIPNSTIGLIDKQNEGYAYIPVSD
ncbi:DsrE family protein [Sulfurimonas sp. CS5]|uniref:DsrE family protein n=1 Tax=Sulfurimonas sp. CS5 TaxID=3391145 RepID=UPI0039E7A29F